MDQPHKNPALKSFVPLSVPDLHGREEAYVVDAIRSSWISSKGKYIDLFEKKFAALSSARNALSVTNGTAALHLAMLALDVQRGDEVIVPTLSYIASANVVRYVGGEPVFVDADPQNWCLNPAAVEAKITPKTKGIIAVHLYGHPADMDALKTIAERHGLWIVEDAAEAHLARYKGAPVGALGTIGTFSFYGNKILTSGEGGVVLTQDEKLAARCRLLRGQGVDPERPYYFSEVGYNFRMTNIACALLCAQLERADELVERRREIFAGYRRRLEGIEGIGFQPCANWAEPAPWLFCITVDESVFGCSRDELATRLRAEQIETRPFFIPIHSLPPYRGVVRDEEFPVSFGLAERGMNLPTFTGMTEGDLDRIAGAIASAAGR